MLFAPLTIRDVGAVTYVILQMRSSHRQCIGYMMFHNTAVYIIITIADVSTDLKDS